MEPTLYIIMRADLPDMNPGKMAAQASHATDDFNAWQKHVESTHLHEGADNLLVSELAVWKEDRNFGRCIVLSGTLKEMEEVVSTNDFAGLTTDPTYPWRNWFGRLFLTEEITAAWCFICDETTPSEALAKLKLHE